MHLPPDSATLAALADTQVLMLVTGTAPDGRAQYAYASIPVGNYLAFKQAEQAGAYDLATFGQILHHGEGTTPSAEIRYEMQQRYGVNHLFEAQLQEFMRGLASE